MRTSRARSIRSVLRSARNLAVAAIALLGTGCTHVYQVNVQPTALPPQSRNPAHVALVLDEALTGFDLRYHAMGDTFVFPLGAGLEAYATNVAQSHFREVTVFPTAQEAAGTGDGILVPRAVKADESHGIFTTTERRVLLEVEWTLKGAQDQGPLWVDTITAEAGRPMGNAFTFKKNERILFQELFDDLSRKTVQAFQESRELQELGRPPSGSAHPSSSAFQSRPGSVGSRNERGPIDRGPDGKSLPSSRRKISSTLEPIERVAVGETPDPNACEARTASARTGSHED